MGNLTELLSKLQPAVYSEIETLTDRNSKNAQYVENVARINTKRSVKSIIERSFILEQMLENGEIGIVGANYDVESGLVEFYEDTLYIKDEENSEFSVAELRH
jgi:carbonic anhydrase